MSRRIETGGGDAGERARAEGLVQSYREDPATLITAIAHYLRSSHREGAEAMRVDAAMAVRSIQGMTTSKEIADAILALPMPGSKADAG